MSCLKCGRDTGAGEVFCENCLEIMEYYPVKPGTAVQLPHRRPETVRKVSKRRGPTLEEQVKALRRRVWILTGCLLVSIIIAVLLGIPAYEHLFTQHFRPGQNYSTVTHPTVPSTAAEG